MVIYTIAHVYANLYFYGYRIFYLLNKNSYVYATLGILSIYSCMLYAIDAILDLYVLNKYVEIYSLVINMCTSSRELLGLSYEIMES